MQTMEQLKENADFWTRIVRGFCEDESGDKTIKIGGEIVTGYWVYGYFVPTENGADIIGGRTIDKINSATNRYSVIFNTITRCTGLLIPVENGAWKPLFGYDVVDVRITEKSTPHKNMTVYWDGYHMLWAVTKMHVPKSGSMPIKSHYSYTIHGTTFDV